MEDELEALSPSVKYNAATNLEIADALQRAEDKFLATMLVYNASRETYYEYWRGLENDFANETKDRYLTNMVQAYKNLNKLVPSEKPRHSRVGLTNEFEEMLFGQVIKKVDKVNKKYPSLVKRERRVTP